MSQNSRPTPPVLSRADSTSRRDQFASSGHQAGHGWLMALFARCEHHFAIRQDRALYALACDSEASEHYGITPSRLWRLSVWFKAFFFAS